MTLEIESGLIRLGWYKLFVFAMAAYKYSCVFAQDSMSGGVCLMSPLMEQKANHLCRQFASRRTLAR